jgi:hypothetical protein
VVGEWSWEGYGYFSGSGRKWVGLGRGYDCRDIEG